MELKVVCGGNIQTGAALETTLVEIGEIKTGDIDVCKLGPVSELEKGVAIEEDVMVAHVTTALVFIEVPIGVAVREVPCVTKLQLLLLLLAFDVKGNNIILRFFCFVGLRGEVIPQVFVDCTSVNWINFCVVLITLTPGPGPNF